MEEVGTPGQTMDRNEGEIAIKYYIQSPTGTSKKRVFHLLGLSQECLLVNEWLQRPPD